MWCSDARRTYGMSRREALQVGVGMFGLTLYDYLKLGKARAAATGKAPRDVSCIFLFLAGGASHFETFDPKPEADSGIRGSWKPISTNVPGTFISEKLPLMAKRMNKVALVRSWQGIDGRHDGGSQHALSGFPAGPRGDDQYFPNMGCLVAALFGSRAKGMPPHVGLPVAGRYTVPPGFLGATHRAFDIKGDPSEPDFTVLDRLAVPRERLEDRYQLMQQLETVEQLGDDPAGGLGLHDKVRAEAYSTLTSPLLKRATNLAAEPQRLRDRYGMDIYGQRVLLARRLVEAGCRFVTINQAVQPRNQKSAAGGSWDAHNKIFDVSLKLEDGSPGNVPVLDRTLSALIEDLDQRGMLQTTLVVVMGEFGRTPRINAQAGRDHYPRAGSVLLAGAGISGGTVVGATDRNGTQPSTVPLTPADFAATIYHALGIDAHGTYFPKLPRPTPIADGNVIKELFA